MENFYLQFKFVHVAAVLIWVGGSMSLAVLTLGMPVKTDRSAALVMAKHASFYGGVVVGAASLIAIIAGFFMLGGVPSGSINWIVWGLLGIPFHIVVGGIMLGYSGRKMKRLLADPATPVEALVGQKNWIASVSFLYLVVMFGIVYAMVTKPMGY